MNYKKIKLTTLSEAMYEQERVAHISGVDYPNISFALKKVEEEIGELKA